MTQFMQWLELLGGLGLFLYGMRVMSDGIQRRAGSKLKKTLSYLTINRFAGVGTGLAVTAIIQSSSATTVLLVSIVNAGLMGLEQAISVIMGANIGTTFTAWIVSLLGFKFKITILALPSVALGMLLSFSKSEKRREISGILIGFGILFLGLSIMKDSVPDIKNNPQALSFLAHFSDVNILNVMLFVLAGTLLTVCVQSSSAAMAITITMAYKGWITFPIAAAIVLGENIGTTITAYLASLGMKVPAKRAARAHMLFNLIGVAWILILFFPFVRMIDAIVPGNPADPTNIPFHLSAFHTVFNIANTCLLIGFIPMIAKVVERLVPSRPTLPERVERLPFVRTQTAEDVESNLISAQAELGRMSSMVLDMSQWVLNSLQENNSSAARTREKIDEFEDLTDQIQQNTSEFLTDCMVGNLNEEQANRIRSMNRIAHELENIGDGCKKITYWLEKRASKKLEFHKSGVEELSDYNTHVLDFLKYNDDHLNNRMKEFSLDHAKKMEKDLNQQRNDLNKIVRKRLISGDDVRAEMIFLDIVRHLEQMGDSCFNISEEITAMDQFGKQTSPQSGD